MSNYDVEAIVLATRQFSESDKMLTVFSREEGKFDVLAKGARKPTGKLRGAANPFSHVQMAIFKGKSIDTLTQACVLNSFSQIVNDINLMANASYALELVKELSAERDKSDVVFRLLLRTLEEYSISIRPQIVTIAFELKIMSYAGFRPNFKKCIICGVEDNIVRFSVDEGGVLCKTCATSLLRTKEISLECRRAAVMLITSDYLKIREISICKDTLIELETLMHEYIDSKIERSLKTRDFIYEVRKIEGDNNK